MKHARDGVSRSDAVRALAEADRRTAVPVGVETSVMAAWDRAHAPARRASGLDRRQVVALAAAAIIAIAIVGRIATRPSALRVTQNREAVAVEPQRVDTPPLRAATAPPQNKPAPARRAAIQPPSINASADNVGLALVVDPMFDPARARVVRLRMPRASLASFGVPIAEPNAAGDVDVEIIVGEDGLARVIRRVRAVPPNSTEEP